MYKRPRIFPDKDAVVNVEDIRFNCSLQNFNRNESVNTLLPLFPVSRVTKALANCLFVCEQTTNRKNKSL